MQFSTGLCHLKAYHRGKIDLCGCQLCEAIFHRWHGLFNADRSVGVRASNE